MEYIVQFAIGIDDEATKKKVVETAEKQIIDNIYNDVKGMLFEKDRYGNITGRPSGMVERKVDAFLESNREDIIELAAEKLADRLSRTKKAKELVK